MGAAKAGPAGGPGGRCGRCGIHLIAGGLPSIAGGLRRRIEELEDGNRGLSTIAHRAGAGEKAAERQAREARGALVDLGADLAESRAGEARAVRERDSAVRERAEAGIAAEAEMSAVRCDLATAQALLEIESGRREQAAGGAGGGSANERMSRPGMAVSTSLSSSGAAAGRERTRQQPQPQQGGGGCGGDGGGMAAKCARLEKENAALKRENAVSSGPNTPGSRLSIANMMRRKFRAVRGLAYRHKESGRKLGG